MAAVNIEREVQTLRLPYAFAQNMGRARPRLFAGCANTGAGGKTLYCALAATAPAFEGFLDEIADYITPETRDERLAAYGAAFFAARGLAVVYTDERSGASTLPIEAVSVDKGVLTLGLLRKRGLTMDMSVRLLLIPLDKGEIEGVTGALAHIRDDEAGEGSLF